jgi:alkanesulfonate monooxygenase SsuD/methylene tetrahydromethanopterin reductase-like flavin-dependent oxidoreductase (luciferase family)
VQPGGVPIWVSGTVNKRVLERIVRFGSGWIPWGPAEAEPATWIPRVHEALAAAGRDVAGFQIAGRLPVVTNDDKDIDVERTMERVAPLVEAGVTDFRTIIRLPSDRAAATERLAGIVSAFKEATK